MPVMHALALVMHVLAAAPPAPEPNGYAIIWGGGADQAAADTAMTSWTEAAKGIGGFLVFPAGYPKIVDSASVPGLKPGFHVVLLGLCPFDDALVPLVLAKAKSPGAYGRATSAAAKDACPTVSPRYTVRPPIVVETAEGTLRGRVVERDWTGEAPGVACDAVACQKKEATCTCVAARGERCDPDSRGSSGSGKKMPYACHATTDFDEAVLLELRDAKEGSLDVKILNTEELGGARCAFAVTPEKDAVVIRAECETPYCSTPNVDVDTLRFTIAKKRLKKAVMSHEHTAGQCDD